MNNLNDAVIKAATAMLIKFNNRLNKSQRENEAILKDWATYLAIERKFTVTQIGHALNSIMRKGVTFMPSAYEIEAELKPKFESSEDRAALVADEIIRYAQAFGYMQTEKAFNDMSEDARIAAGSPSFLLEVCNTPGDDLTTLKAQIRRRAKAAFERTQITQDNQKLAQIGIVIPFNALELRQMEYAGFLPEGDPA